MKVLLQSYNDGSLTIAEVPAPTGRRGRLLVENVVSLVSAGTERYQLDLARKNLIGKAMARPDLVSRVVQKARTEGVMEAWQQATQRLNVPVPLGYSSAGVVKEVGDGAGDFAVGDRVACTGSGFASHAEIVSVPHRMCVHVPATVNFESASFAALGGVALEAIRMAEVNIGSYVGVIGLGLIGQIAVQLLRAAGCHVFGIDLSPARTAMALAHGADLVAQSSSEDVLGIGRELTHGSGLDSCIILAAANSNEPLELAAELTRERGRVVAAGLVGLQLPRKPFYDKELELVVSRAWGAGIYDPAYSERGADYPVGYARWTAERNLNAFMAQLGRGTVTLNHLITHRFPLEQAAQAYDLILGGTEPSLGVLLTYPAAVVSPKSDGEIAIEGDLPYEAATDGPVAVELADSSPQPSLVRIEEQDEDVETSAPAALPVQGQVGIGLVGAGLFARTTLLPVLAAHRGVSLRGIVTASGITAYHSSRQFGFAYATSDRLQLLRDPRVTGVIIATRHDLHAGFAAEALRAGKAVLVEKPLAVTTDELRSLAGAWAEFRAPNAETDRLIEPRLMVGFNRRYSPFVEQMRRWFGDRNTPLAVHCRVNAGVVPPDSWVNEPNEGGGRVIGEVCHFVDLVHALTGSLTTRVYAQTLRNSGFHPDENVVITLHLENGSVASILYVANGDKAFPRERVEVFGGSAVGVIDNYRTATFTRGGKRATLRRLNVDRGYSAEVKAFLSMLRGSPPPVPFKVNLATTLTTFAVESSLRSNQPVTVDLSDVLES